MELTIKNLPELPCTPAQLEQIKRCAAAILRGESVKISGEPVSAEPAAQSGPDEISEALPRPYAT
jgi:hypothetical protein